MSVPRNRDWLSTVEVARMLGVSRPTIYALMARELDPLPFSQITKPFGWRRVTMADLATWQDSNVRTRNLVDNSMGILEESLKSSNEALRLKAAIAIIRLAWKPLNMGTEQPVTAFDKPNLDASMRDALEKTRKECEQIKAWCENRVPASEAAVPIIPKDEIK
ncbi:MAG: hypothetical protein ACD_28C00221G0003 [uncultured bacterium]|nr:MAG: hypothetical protein ACD_28C00221G0003 [uncultured bacterium]